ncbi:MAG: DUF4159 domain-containing protein [Pirellulaceae bacterium]
MNPSVPAGCWQRAFVWRGTVWSGLLWAAVAWPGLTHGDEGSATTRSKDAGQIPDSRQIGGEPEGVVQVANLVYAGVKSSQCFSDHFLIETQKATAISTSRRFHAVKLHDDEIYSHPLLIMTGEGTFSLTDPERENLRRYIGRGGFLLASAGCSSQEWDRSFRRELASIFAEHPLSPLSMDHPVFHTVRDISELEATHGTPRPLEGITIQGRLAIVYSQDGLNDTAHMQGCCCCGGNEISNSVEVNVNILAYALTH